MKITNFKVGRSCILLRKNNFLVQNEIIIIEITAALKKNGVKNPERISQNNKSTNMLQNIFNFIYQFGIKKRFSQSYFYF